MQKNISKKHHWLPQYVMRNLTGESKDAYFLLKQMKNVEKRAFSSIGFIKKLHFDENNKNLENLITVLMDTHFANWINNFIKKLDNNDYLISYEELKWLLHYHNSIHMRHWLRDEYIENGNKIPIKKMKAFLNEYYMDLDDPKLAKLLWFNKNSVFNLYIIKSNYKLIFGDYSTLCFRENELINLIIPLSKKYILQFKNDLRHENFSLLKRELNKIESKECIEIFCKFFTKKSIEEAKEFIYSSHEINEEEKRNFLK